MSSADSTEGMVSVTSTLICDRLVKLAHEKKTDHLDMTIAAQTKPNQNKHIGHAIGTWFNVRTTERREVT